jgi:hypothetical protein
MFSNQDACEVGGLEVIFRSHQFGRATGAEEAGEVSDLACRENVIFAKEFGRPLTPVSLHDVDGDAERRLSGGGGRPEEPGTEETEGPEPAPQIAPSEGGAGLGAQEAEAASTPPPPKRPVTRYWTIASVGALAALVAAGITAGPNQHPRSDISAQGRHGTARPNSRAHTPRATSTGSTAPSGALTAAAGSGGLSSGTGTSTDGGRGSGNSPGGHVALVGPATFTGTPVSPTVSSTSPGGSGGTTGSPPTSGSTNPGAPVTSVVGSAASALGSTVTTAASQLGSSVPAAASTAGVVNTVVDALDQAVSASPG